MKTLDIAAFAEITKRVIARDGEIAFEQVPEPSFTRFAGPRRACVAVAGTESDS